MSEKVEGEKEESVITVDCGLVYKMHYPKDFSQPMKQEVVAKVFSAKDAKVERKCVEVCVVLDISGSMEGKPLEMSKNALVHLMKCLGKDDRCSFVTYHKKAEVIARDVTLNRSKSDVDLRHSIQNIKAKGTTNMEAGIQAGFKILRESRIALRKWNKENRGKKDFKRITRQRHMFLFTDGLVNEGVQEPAKIYDVIKKMKKQKITVSTFGFSTDFDQKMMQMIAEYGRGTYYYIEVPEDDGSSKKTKKAENKILIYFERAFKLASKVVLSNAILKVIPRNGTKILKIHCFDEKSITKGIKCGDIHQNDFRNFLIEVEVAPQQKKPIMELKLGGNDPITTEVFEIKKEFMTEKTADVSLYTKEIDEIGHRKTLIEVVRDNKKIEKMVDEDDDPDDIKEKIKDLLDKVHPLVGKYQEAKYFDTQLKNCLKMIDEDNYEAIIKNLDNQRRFVVQSPLTFDHWGN